jgi:hypothetical protein
MAVIPTEEERAEIAARGQAIYDEKKTLLEPEFSNQYVAIHVDTGDYVVAKNSASATRALHARHSPGRAYTRKIGDEPEYGLAARLLVGEMMTGRFK